MKIRKRIIFYGYVQGVGFRYRARRAAELYGCTGWARNEWDGTVTMELQGEEAAVDSVLTAMNRSLYIRIDRMELKTIPVDEEERGFGIE